MADEYDIKEVATLIESLREDTEKLREISEGYATVQKNADRILANVRMLEINVSDIVELID